MSINKKYIDFFVNVTSKAALASSYFVGKKDKIAADKAATDAMRSELNMIDINGKIVIGEGELDDAYYAIPEYDCNSDAKSSVDGARCTLYHLKDTLEKLVK